MVSNTLNSFKNQKIMQASEKFTQYNHIFHNIRYHPFVAAPLVPEGFRLVWGLGKIEDRIKIRIIMFIN